VSAMSPTAMPLTAFSNFAVLQPKKKADPAPTLSASYRKRMRDDPKYDRISTLEEGAMNHIKDSGWAGALAQAVNGYMAGRETRALEKDYLSQQEHRQATIDQLLDKDPTVDPAIREMARDPEFSDFAVTAYARSKLDQKPAKDYDTVTANGKVWRVNRSDPNDKTEMGDAKADERKTSRVQMVGSQGPGEYLINDATGDEVRKVGNIYNKPSDRQPSAGDEKYNYLRGQGVPDARARGLAYGGISLSTDANGVVWEVDGATGQRKMVEQPAGGSSPSPTSSRPPGAQGTTPPKAASDRASQNDSIDVAMAKLDDMLGSDDWQSNSGIENVVKRGANAVGGMFGAQASPEMTRRGQDVSQLKQSLTDAMANDPRTNEGDFKRIEELVPGNGLFDSDAANRTAMAKARAYLEEIRNRPLAVDPRTGDGRAPQMGSGHDPLGILK
jgi:hypothetical protein